MLIFPLKSNRYPPSEGLALTANMEKGIPASKSNFSSFDFKVFENTDFQKVRQVPSIMDIIQTASKVITYGHGKPK